MIITCEACNTSFNLDSKMLKPTGSKVRCSVCAKIFTAFPPQAPAQETPAPPAEPEPESAVQTGTEPGLSAAATVASAAADSAPTADAAETSAPETDGFEAQDDDLFADDTDLDLAMADEPEDTTAATEIEDAVSEAFKQEPAAVLAESDLADESESTIIASLDDDDLDLDLRPQQGPEDGTATVIADLDEDLDLGLDEPADITEASTADQTQEDLDLDLTAGIDGDPEGTATVIANLDDDTFDLGDDFSSATEDAEKSAVSAPDGGPETLEDVDDLDLTLDMEALDDSSPEVPGTPEPGDDSLDDLSLDFDLEPEAESADAASTEGIAQADDIDAELSLDVDDGAATADKPVSEVSDLEDDLDLSSLESLLDDDDAAADDDVSMVVDGDEDQELSLDMDDETPVAEADGDGEPDEALEDLEFDLDGKGKPEAVDVDDGGDDQEIDLSEIERMLEEPEQESAKFSDVPEQDLDLDIEASLETEKWMSESGDDDQLVMDEELDLSELEQALDDVDTDAADDTPEDAELELELGDGEQLGEPAETVAVDSELDFDLSDFEDAATPPSGKDSALRESVDMELEFEVEEGAKAEQSLEDEGLEETVAIPEPTVTAPDTAPPEPSATPAAPPKPQPVKKGVSKSLIFLLIIVILGGGGYGTYYLLKQNNIDIPFLSDYLKPKVTDPGNLKLTTYDINSKFVDNANIGKLFVISGKVKNGYAENRGMVTLAGKIFSTGKVLANQEKIYGGNIMSDLELANLEWDKIKARLSNRLGDNRSNVKIEPGQSIPFMVVFSNLPEDLEEFTIEVTGSTSLK